MEGKMEMKELSWAWSLHRGPSLCPPVAWVAEVTEGGLRSAEVRGPTGASSAAFPAALGALKTFVFTIMYMQYQSKFSFNP